MAKPPARSVNGFPSFASTRAAPVTIIRCSFGVCQCQGIEQPAANLARMTEGAFEGSPLCTEPGAHVGSPGTVMNFISDMFRAVGCPPACCPRAKPGTNRIDEAVSMV